MISRAVSAAECAAIYQLRYEVLVDEQGVSGDPSIDHAGRAVIDPADSTGILLATWVNGELAGAVRTNLLRDGPALPFSDVLGLEKLPYAELERVSVTSRLVVAARWRRAPLGVRLAQAISRFCREAGMEFDYIVVRPQMISWFTRLGYVQLAAVLEFPGVGGIAPMRLNLDLAYLREIRSVLVVGM